jgi:hypothetical protein
MSWKRRALPLRNVFSRTAGVYTTKVSDFHSSFEYPLPQYEGPHLSPLPVPHAPQRHRATPHRMAIPNAQQQHSTAILLPNSGRHEDELSRIRRKQPDKRVEPPDGGVRAWLVVFGAFSATLCTFGYINSVGYRAWFPAGSAAVLMVWS